MTTKNTSKKRDLPPRPVIVPKKSIPKPKKETLKVSASLTSPAPLEAPFGSKERSVRHRPTVTDHIERCSSAIKLCDDEIERRGREKEKGTRAFRSIRKILKQMKKDIPYITHMKRSRMQTKEGSKPIQSGLMMNFQISDELSEFLELPHGSKISRSEATCAICVYSHLKENETREHMLAWKYLNPEGKRNLQNSRDKRAIIPDKVLTKLLRYNDYKRKVASGAIQRSNINKETGKIETTTVTNDSLYYWVIQKLLSVHFIKVPPKVKGVSKSNTPSTKTNLKKKDAEEDEEEDSEKEDADAEPEEAEDADSQEEEESEEEN
jgi:hypothetical protein